MKTRLFRKKEMTFTMHPRFKNVGLATFITGKDTDTASVCLLDIPPEHGLPIHMHDPQVDSIFVVSGKGEAYVNGTWEPVEAGDYIFVPGTEEHGMRNTGNESLKIFVHHSPPLM
jgi:quercetin dioxygenase-like cupin family protein